MTSRFDRYLVGGRPERLRSDSPATRSSKNRLRYLITVLTAISGRSAMDAFSSPSADASTVLARSTNPLLSRPATNDRLQLIPLGVGQLDHRGGFVAASSLTAIRLRPRPAFSPLGNKSHAFIFGRVVNHLGLDDRSKRYKELRQLADRGSRKSRRPFILGRYYDLAKSRRRGRRSPNQSRASGWS